MISIAIANYNRSDMTMEAFAKVLDNPFVSEVVIVDDCSDVEVYEDLARKIEGLDKVVLYRNDENLGPFLNKAEAVWNCTSEWVIILDCDNIIDNDYINFAENIEKRNDTIYCPAVVRILRPEGGQWDFTLLSGGVDKNTAKDFVDIRLFKILMNTGNYLINRKACLNTFVARMFSADLSELDTFYFNYLWIESGGLLSVTSGLTYIHRIHDDSYYLKNADLFLSIQKRLTNLIKEL